MNDIGRLLVAIGLGLLLIGGLFLLLSRFGISLGSLPGDFRFELGQFTCLVPIATGIILSIILTIGLNLLLRLFNR